MSEPYAHCDLCGRNPRRLDNCPFAGEPDGGMTCSCAWDIAKRVHEPTQGRDWQNARKQPGLGNRR